MKTTNLRAAFLTGMVAFAGVAQAFTVPPGPGNTSSSASVAPTKLSAPLLGMIVSINVKAGDIVINGQHFLVSTPLLALIDKRPGADGLLSLNTLQPGMSVSYRTEKEGDATRVVEMWVLRNPGTVKMK